MKANVARFIAAIGISLFPASLPHAGGAKVSDTGYEIIRPFVAPSLHWIDNNRLLFAGANRLEMQAAIAANDGDRGNRLRKLYLWDASTKLVKLYADAKGACLANGIVRYTVRVDKAAGKAIVREGPFGSEKEVEKPLPSEDELSTQGQMARVRSNFTCKAHLRSELVPPPRRDRGIVVLREGDGYLDLGPNIGADFAERRAQPRNLVLYEARNGRAIQLPMTWEEDFSPSGVVYSTYRQAYVLRPRAPRGAPIGISQPWPKGKPLTAYLLWADGRLESISIPYFHTPGLGNPQPVKAGWVFGGGYFDKTGLYLFDGKAISKLDAGAEQEIAVSPNGCKAAVAIQNKHLGMGTPTNLRVFNFCAGGR